MSQREKLQRELRDAEKLSCVPQEAQDALKNVLQQQLPELEQKRHDFTPESAEKDRKRRNLQKDSAAAQEEMWKLHEEFKQKEERILFLSTTTSIRTKWLMQDQCPPLHLWLLSCGFAAAIDPVLRPTA